MALIGNYIRAFQKCVQFSGRATRSEYWLFQIVNLVIIAVLFFVALQTGWNTSFIVVIALYALASLLPRMALAMRRLHDTGRSGIWLLLHAIPLFGMVILLFMYAGGSDWDNRYGPAPQ